MMVGEPLAVSVTVGRTASRTTVMERLPVASPTREDNQSRSKMTLVPVAAFKRLSLVTKRSHRSDWAVAKWMASGR